MLIETIESKKEMLYNLLQLTNEKKKVYQLAFTNYKEDNRGYDEWVDFAAEEDSFSLSEKDADLKSFFRTLNKEEFKVVHTLMWIGLHKNSLTDETPKTVLDLIGIGFANQEWESKEEEIDFLVSKPLLHDYLSGGIEVLSIDLAAPQH